MPCYEVLWGKQAMVKPFEEFHKIITIGEVWKFEYPDESVQEEIYRMLRRGEPISRAIMVYEESTKDIVKYKRMKGNILLYEGINFMWNCIMNGNCSPPFDGQNTHLGVGDGTTAEDPTQTGLQGANKYYKQVDAGYPQVSTNAFIARATFGPNEAAFHWQEWTVANGPDDTATNLNRKVVDLGVKSDTATWVLAVTLLIQ